MSKLSRVLLVSTFVVVLFAAGVSTSYAGWTLIQYDNDTNVVWGDFHLEISAIEGHDISNVVFDVTGADSSQSLDSAPTLSNGGKQLNFFFNHSDPIAPGDKDSWWLANIDNPDGVLHKVTFYPTMAVAPEPVSSTLFLVGAATLGFRRYRKVKRGA